MTDELDALKAALKASPTPDPEAKAAALRLAMENFDRLQGSTDGSRLSQDRPNGAGFLNGVRKMLKTLNTRPALAATTSAAALMIGLFVAWPLLQVQQSPEAENPKPLTEEIAPPALQKESKDQVVDLGRTEQTVATGSVAQPLAPAEDKAARADTAAPANTLTLAEPDADASAVETDTLAQLAQNAPGPAPLAKRSTTQEAQVLTDAMTSGLAAPATMDETVALPDPNTEAFSTAAASPVHVTAEEPVSTFSVDVDTASYSIIRSSLNAGQLPPPDAVRIEEMINYFPYSYPAPAADGAPFTNTVTVMATPWNPNTRLVHIGLQGRMPATEDRAPLNLVFLIDTSGSMEDANKLPLLKQSFALMLGKLRPQDRVAIVAYAGSAGQVLAPTAASDRGAILNALNNLAAGGSTAGAQGLALAYQVAGEMAEAGEVSRVILATDGDFNVGIDNPDDLKAYIATQRDQGTYLSVLGFGRGNLDDATMQALAQNGNGTAAYIDTLAEAQKVLVDQLTGALFPIADDVKIQVEWNPASVAEYRLIGYETRALRREDFNNDRIDAGEIGAGLQVTALYEVTAPGSPALLNDPLRYGAQPEAGASGELGFLRLRYKEPGQTTSNLIETPITGVDEPGTDARFAAAIAGFGQLLQGSPYVGNWGYDQAITLATQAKGQDEFGYRAEAVTLMRLAQSLSGQ
jgi:Ca-activated chloride channel homolog